ncbi:Uncharacterized protein HZ326_23381 [Fusarium oxysporum f. sp. albedinis]|nr:Uncharacterized protein HZ326_23381 [Fusarium oxysporum f. sp. albedinis]
MTMTPGYTRTPPCSLMTLAATHPSCHGASNMLQTLAWFLACELDLSLLQRQKQKQFSIRNLPIEHSWKHE